MAERIRKAIKNCKFEFNDELITTTVSIGIATYPNDDDDKDNLIIKADKALYFAKEHGRNRSCSYHAAKEN